MVATYLSKQAVTLATRDIAHARLITLIQHLVALDVNLVSIVRRADNFIEVTLSGPLPAGQISHLGLMEP